MGINIKLYGHVLTVLDIKLTDAVFAEYPEDATFRILTWNFDDIVLRHP